MTHINTPSSRRGSTRTRSFKNDDMIKKLSGLIEGQRVGVFIDAANLYFGTSSKGIHISYEAIIDWFRTHTKSCFLNFYTAYKPEETKQTDFLAEMENLGYRIVKKPVKIFADNNMKGNLDIELAVDSIELRDTFDVYILISGDGDFQYVFQKLKGYGKTTLLIGVGGFTSFELHAEADHYFFIDRIRAVWQEKKRLKSQSQYYVFVDQVSQIDHAESLSMVVPPKEQKARDMDIKTKLDTLKTKQTRLPRVRTRSRPTDATSSAIDPQVYL